MLLHIIKQQYVYMVHIKKSFDHTKSDNFSLTFKFHAAESTLGSTRETSQDDFMVPTQSTSLESHPGTKSTSLKGTEVFELSLKIVKKTDLGTNF